jgi:catechol 2,3-dioxygenase-like lactoylglutathione lyase family enzyme
VQVRQVLESCLYVDDLTEAFGFYSQVLGLEVHSHQSGRHLFFHCGDGMVLLFKPESTALPSGPVPTHGAFGPGHIAFAVDRTELPAWKEHLKNLGVLIEAEVTWPNGGRSIYFRDPSNNSVELATPDTWQPSDPE